MTRLFGAQHKPSHGMIFPLPRGICFMHFTPSPEAEVSASQDPFQVKVPRSVLHHTKEEKISSCKSVYFLKFMLP